MIKLITTCFLILLTSVSLAEQKKLSNEYIALRKEVYEKENSEFEQCTEQIAKKKYREAYEKCNADGAGKNIGGGCAHIAEYATARKLYETDEYSKCDELKPKKGEISQILEKKAQERNIKKYQ